MLERRGSLDEKLTRLSNAEETQASQDEAVVMAAIKERERAAMQSEAPSPKRLGGGLTHLQAALRREMEVNQVAAAGGGGVEHQLAEAAEAAKAQNRLEKAPRGRMSEAVKLVRQSSYQGATRTKQGLLNLVTESRNRHSVLQVAVPLELDAHDPVHLRDEQTCQVYVA